MDLTKVLKLECCEIELKENNKDNVLKRLALLMQRSKHLQNLSTEEIVKGLRDREEKGSTGFGNGIAIPHCQLKNAKEFVVGLAISEKGVDFDALDGKKAHIFVVILGPEGDPSTHIKLLAQVSRVLREEDVRRELIASKTKYSLYEEFLRNINVEASSDIERGKDKLMMIVLRDEEILTDITEIFIEYGIQEATILESQQMKNLLSNVPLFLGFFNFTGEKSPFHKIIMTKINENRLNAVVRSIEDITGNLDSYSGLTIMALDLFFAKGQL